MDTSEGAAAQEALRFDRRRGRMVTGAVAALGFGAYLVEALGMPRGTMDAPSAGMFPVVVGAVGSVIGLLVLVEAALKASETGELPTGRQGRHVLLFLACLAGLVLALPILGQYVAATVYGAVLVRFISPLPWWRAVLVGAACGLALSWVFVELIGIRMPSGVW